MKYAILEKMFFPGRWVLMHLCWLQMAESALKFNRGHYYERAVQRGDMLLYGYEDAQAIIGYWQRRYPDYEFMLMAAPDTINSFV